MSAPMSTPPPTARKSIPMGEGSLIPRSTPPASAAALNKRRQSMPLGVRPPSTPGFSGGSGGTPPSPYPWGSGNTPDSGRRTYFQSSPGHHRSSSDPRVLLSPSLSQQQSMGVNPYPPPENENITVTVRFRPLSVREVKKGHEVGWYADGDNVVRMESNNAIAFAFDRVFGPATSTRGVYDIAAHPVVGASMEGVNGTVFAYGVTSSGKTHTMHGDQKSPGIIPLAVKEVFSIIQETPGREFLLRVSYMEIYNEVINDLLNPTGQNLRIREDSQLGTYVENIKEEVVLSPAHALSLIAAGEEHRHVGATNYNMISSRSHTIFTLTIESTGVDSEGNEEVALSQLHLIDLAGSESSKVVTTGVRRREGSYINKSLLTLGTVIQKLSEGKHTHIPFRDSKLTRLLQSSLSGSGRISLICNVTPASGCLEETHNTLKFATRAKHVEVRAEQNKILDEKSLIRKYQREITQLRMELQRVKRNLTLSGGSPSGSQDEDITLLREKLEADQVLMQTRLEEEEQAKAALMGRIQRLTKLILVSTKTSMEPIDKPAHRRRLSFGEEDLAYLKQRRIDFGFDYDDMTSWQGSDDESVAGGGGIEEEKKPKRRGVLSWLKLKRQSNESSISGTPGSYSYRSSPARSIDNDLMAPSSPDSIKSMNPSRKKFGSESPHRATRSMSIPMAVDLTKQDTAAGELISTKRRPSLGPREIDLADQLELQKEQLKILSAEVAFLTSTVKRLREQPTSPTSTHEAEILKVEEEIAEKRQQMKGLEHRLQAMSVLQPPDSNPDIAKTLAKLKAMLSEKTFDMEIINADNRHLQDSLRVKTRQHEQLMEEVNLLRVELTRAIGGSYHHPTTAKPNHVHQAGVDEAGNSLLDQSDELVPGIGDENNMTPGSRGPLQLPRNMGDGEFALAQVAEMEDLRLHMKVLLEERETLLQQQHNLAGELAKARATAVVQPNAEGADYLPDPPSPGEKDAQLAEMAGQLQVSRLRERKMAADLGSRNAELAEARRREQALQEALRAAEARHAAATALVNEAKARDLARGAEERVIPGSSEQAQKFQAALDAKEKEITAMQQEMDEARAREGALENDLATMWVLVAELRRASAARDLGVPPASLARDMGATPGSLANGHARTPSRDQLRVGGGSALTMPPLIPAAAEEQKVTATRTKGEENKEAAQQLKKLEADLALLKGNELDGVALETLDELANVHEEALAKLAYAKIKEQQRQRQQLEGRVTHEGIRAQLEEFHQRGIAATAFCKNCFDADMDTELEPCGHVCLCAACADDTQMCPICFSAVKGRKAAPPPPAQAF